MKSDMFLQRFFYINQAKTNSVVELQSWTKIVEDGKDLLLALHGGKFCERV